MIQAEAFEALASSSNGIAKLRELILELAVRGLLVPQDPNDEPASELLKRINFNDQVKKDSIHPTYSNSIVEKQLPTGWEYVKLEQIANVGTGTTPSRGKPEYFLPPLIPWVTSGETSTPFIKHTAEHISELALKETSLKIYPIGTLIMAMYGQGKTRGQISELTIEATTNQACAAIVLKLKDEWHRRYIKLHFQKQYDEIREASAGGAQPNLNVGKVKATLISLPPIEEQLRIVTKVDELMTLCDQLEQRQNHSNTVHQRLLQTLLESLTQAADNEAFQKIWSQIAAHFDTLFTTEASVDQLKQVVLQLAVMGKLVSQDSNDEPASVLLKRIAEKKVQLVKKGEIKKQKQLPNIEEDEKQFEAPKGWEWCRLQEIVFLLGDGLHGTPEYTDNAKFYFINGNNLNNGQIVIKPETKTVAQDQYEKHKKQLGENSVLVSINGTLGNVAFYNNEKVILGKSACYFNLAEEIYKRFIKIIIDAPSFINYAHKNATGSTIKNLGLSAMNSLPIALPPTQEQHRIVAKVDELMAICDLLKNRISKSQQIQEHLATAIVEKTAA